VCGPASSPCTADREAIARGAYAIRRLTLNMGVQDRQWYWEERLRKEKLYYNPRAFRDRKIEQATAPTETRRSAVGLFVVIACVVVAALAFVSGRHIESALTPQQAQGPKQVREAQLSEEEARAESARRRQERLSAFQQQESRRLQELAAQRERDSSANASAAQAEERRKAAWAKFYRPSPRCEGSGTVECANEFIRARRKFEAQYSAIDR
jgi:hypothetical protein